MKKKHLMFPICMMLFLSGCVMYNGLPPEDASCEHTYSEEYSFDEKEHWHKATCEHSDLRKDVVEHTFGDFVVTQEPTLAKEGLKVRTCTACGYKDEVVIEKFADGGQGNGEIGGGGEVEQWNITDITFDRTSIELTVGENPISVVPRIIGEGKFPTSLNVKCDDVATIETVDGEEVTTLVKIAEISSNVVESGSAFTVKPLAAGNTKITVTSVGKTNISKEISVVINPKVEVHELTISESFIEMNKGSIRVLGCESTDNVTWTSSDETVVALENKTNTGVWLKSLKASGDTPITITATICAGTEYEVVKTCTVTVISTDQTIFDYYFINNLGLKDLHLYMWGECGTNADWPGVSMGEYIFKDKSYNNVYKITIDTDVKPYEKIIVSGKDYNDEFLQTNDIVLASFKTQNAFTIPDLPSAGSDGVRKASIKMCNFNPDTDVLEGGYITLSMNEADVLVNGTLDVITYTSEETVEYTIVNGTGSVELSNKSKNGFTVKGLTAGTSEIHAMINVDGNYIGATLYVTVIEDREVTYYFENNYQWTNLKVYLWGTKGENAPFPGARFKNAPVKNSNGVNTYALSFKVYSDGYTYMTISGNDNDHGWSQTKDILLSDMDVNGNMISIREEKWDNFSFVGEDKIYKCDYSYGTFEPFGPHISINEDEMQIIAGQTVDIPVSTNTEFEIINSDDTVIEATKAADKINVKGLKEGSATITAKVDDNIKDSITIKVVEDYEVTYYFVNNYNWSNLKVYLWNEEGHNTDYPGASLGERSFINRDGHYVYSITFNKYADNYDAFIITGDDAEKGQECKTEDIIISDFGDDNGIELTGWKTGTEKTATFKFGFYFYELYLDISSTVEFKAGASIPLTVRTNGENIAYQITSGSDVIELQNQSDTGVTIKGLSAGTATFTATVSDGTHTVTKICTVTVIQDEPDYVTYYFANSYLWSDLYVYMWNDTKHTENATFPGEAITAIPVKNSLGQDTYAITFDRNEHNWTNCVISGIDGTHGWAKTYDISFAGLDADGTNMVTINETGWGTVDHLSEGQDIYKCTYSTGVFAEFVPDVSISESTKTIYLGRTYEISVNSNILFDVACSDSEVIQVTKSDNKILLVGLKGGQANIDVYVDRGGENEKKVSCLVTVEPLYLYTITEVDDWFTNDNAELYVCVFDNDDNGTWIPVEYDNGTISFTSSRGDFTKVVLIRRDPAIDGDPTWENIWNQSLDLYFVNWTVKFVEKP